MVDLPTVSLLTFTKPIYPQAKISSPRTLARSRELEAGERAKVRQGPRRSSARSFSDDPSEDIEDTAAATVQQDDDIDFLDPVSAGDVYRDEMDGDGGNDPFKYEDENEDAIGLDKRPPRR